MGSLTLIIRQSKSHTMPLDSGIETLLREPIVTLDGKVSVMLTKSAKGTHHRRRICLKPKPTGSFEIRGTVKPGSNDGCREFVAQVHPPLNPDSVYSLWKDPPRRIKKQVADPMPSKASIESFRTATPAPASFNLNEFWRVEAHLNEALGCLAAVDIEDDVVNGDAFRTAVRMVLESRGLNPVALDLAQSLSTLSRDGRVKSIGNTRPFKSYRLFQASAIKEEEKVATTAEQLAHKEESRSDFVLRGFWKLNDKALEGLTWLVINQLRSGLINKNELCAAIGQVIQEHGGEGSAKQVGISLAALTLMGVIESIDDDNYRWNGVRASNDKYVKGSKGGANVPLVAVVSIATIVEQLVAKTKGDDGFLSKETLYAVLGDLYAKQRGKQPTKTKIGHAVHRLFDDGILETKGLRGEKTYHLSRSAISDAATRKVVAPKVDSFSGPLPLTEILEALTTAAGSDHCLTIRVTVETVSKTANCDEDKAVELIDELLKNGYLHFTKGRDLCSHMITAKALLHLKEKKKCDPLVEIAEPPAPLAAEALKGGNSPARSSHSADARTIGDVTPPNGFGQLAKVSAALQTIDNKIVSEKEKMASAQATVALAQKAITVLEEDRRHLQSAEEALKQASKEAAELTAKYSE